MMIDIALTRANEIDQMTGEDKVTPEKKAKQSKKQQPTGIPAWELEEGTYYWTHCVPLPQGKGLHNYKDRAATRKVCPIMESQAEALVAQLVMIAQVHQVMLLVVQAVLEL